MVVSPCSSATRKGVTALAPQRAPTFGETPKSKNELTAGFQPPSAASVMAVTLLFACVHAKHTSVN